MLKASEPIIQNDSCHFIKNKILIFRKNKKKQKTNETIYPILYCNQYIADQFEKHFHSSIF